MNKVSNAKRVDPVAQDTVTESVSEPGGVAGTLAYMAPEQLKGEKVDSRADLWAAGVVLYEMATGRRPFDGKTSAALADEIFHVPAPPPQGLQPMLSSRMADIILKCLEKDAENRYQSAKELLVDLRRLAMPAMLATVEVPSPRRPVPARAIFITAAVVVLVMIATTATYLYFARKKIAVAATPQITSLAVLPLANLSGDPNQEYFADGMTEGLITDLSKIRALKVISRTSVMRYRGTNKPIPEIARELGVNGIIEGSVQRSGKRMRITAQLINANDTHVWADNFDRDMRDVLKLESEVARAIAQQIRVAVTPAEQQQLASARPVNPEAHELYLKGRYFWWKRRAEDLKKASELFEQAIAIDPQYAPAYAGLADAYTTTVNNGIQPPEMFKQRAKAAALKAVALDDSLAEAHVALGRVYNNFDWDWARSEAEYRRALELDPNSASAYLAYADMVSRLGRHEEAIANDRRAQELDPLATRINAHLVMVLYHARRYDDAIAAAKRNLEFDPSDRLSHIYLGMTYFQKGLVAKAVAELEPFREDAGPFAQRLAIVYAASGQTEEARRAVANWTEESRRRYKSPYGLAVAHLADANLDQVFAYLEKAYQTRDPWVIFINIDPIWDRFRSDPRFKGLLRRLNLKP